MKSLQGLLIVAVLGIAALPLWRTSPAVKTPADSHPPSEAPLRKKDAVRPSVAPAFTVPSAFAQDPIRRFAFVKDCAKFRHFDSFYRQQAADPSWPLNSPEALAAAEPEFRSKLLKTSKFLEEHRQSCTAWIEAKPQDLVNAQIYDASLQAALEGDQNAAACFVMASWQAPSSQSQYYSGLVEAYATHAPRFVQDGLRLGSWPVALAAYHATREEHGFRTSLGLSKQDIYLLARLAQMGSPDAEAESQYRDQAADSSRNLGAGQIVALDKRASGLFANEFKKGRVGIQSVADMCVN